MRAKKPSFNFVPSEHDEQCNFIAWFRTQYPKLSGCLFAIPNGGLRNLKVAKKLQAEGVLAGVADLFLMVPAGKYYGLFIEMKIRTGGSQSASQKEFERMANKNGYLYFLAAGSAQAEKAVKNYLDLGRGQDA